MSVIETRRAAELAIRLATERGERIAVAESLTGGLVVSALVGIPGASLAVSGGVVAYDTEVKRSLLGVDAALLEEVGPVDGEVARQMARGVRDACAAPLPAAIGVSTTGVAGPDPDPQTGQPPGVVWVGISSERGDRAIKLRFSGDRGRVRAGAVLAALRALIEEFRAE